MKARLISLLLIVALLVTVAVFAVEAADPTPANFAGATGTVTNQWCEHCGDFKDWEAWDYSLGTAPTSGHYYLADNGGGPSIKGASGSTLCLHLNGKTLTRDGRVGAIVGDFAIMDYATNEGTISGYPWDGATSGGIFSILTNAKLTVYGGTLQPLFKAAGSGQTTAVNGGVLYMQAGSEVKILGGKLINGKASVNGGLIYVNTNCAVTISDAILSTGTAVGKGGAIFVGGSESAPSRVTLTNTTITGCSSTGNEGGGIYVNPWSTVTMNNSDISGCSAGTLGGSIAATTGANVYLNNGSDITGGKAPDGGNLYMNSGAACYVNEGATVADGEATTTGGNYYAQWGDIDVDRGEELGLTGVKRAVLVIAGGSVTGGKAPNGGSCYLESNGALVMKSGTLSGGVASAGSGGNLFLSDANSEAHINGGTVSGGQAQGNNANGGNVHVGAGVFNMAGGMITGGKATNYGGNLSLLGGTANVSGGTIYFTKGSTNANGKSIGIYNGTLNLSGEANITGGYWDATDKVFYHDIFVRQKKSTETLNPTVNISGSADAGYIYFPQYPSNGYILGAVNVQADFTGEVHFIWQATNLGNSVDGAAVSKLNFGKHGANLPNHIKVVGDYANTASIYALDGSFSQKPVAYGDFNGNGTNELYTTAFTGVKYNAEGEAVETPIAGVSAKDMEGFEHVRVFDSFEISLETDTVLDLNDQVMTVNTNGHKLSLVDYRDDGYTGEKGYAIVSDASDLKLDVTVAGKDVRYITLPYSGAANAYQPHRIELEISQVSFRPGAAGIYYTANVKCDDALADQINDYGVAVSLTDMPGADYIRDGKVLYTLNQVADGAFTAGNFTGVMIEGILDDKLQNYSTYADMKIYANAYVTLAGVNGLPESFGGSLTIMADNVNGGTTNGVAYSLNDVLTAIDGQWDGLETAAQTLVNNFYTKWSEEVGTWNFTKIGKTSA